MKQSRLSAKLAALRFEEAQIGVFKDIDLISQWAARFDSFAARQAHASCHVMSSHKRFKTVVLQHPLYLAQGSMDVKYLTDRYQNGLREVDRLLKDTQRFFSCDDLSEVASDAITQLANSGNQSQLVLFQTWHYH